MAKRRFALINHTHDVGVWGTQKTASFTFTADQKFVMEATSAVATATLPAIIADKDEFVLHNSSASTKVVSIAPNGHTIKGPEDSIETGDTLVLAVGETAHMIAVSSSTLEFV